MAQQYRLLSEDDIKRTTMRFAHQFLEPFDDPSSLAIIGMQTRGIYLAKYIRENILYYYKKDIPVGVLDVTFYRDDFRTKMKLPTVQITEIPFDIYEKNIIVVDDVLYTGRTLRAAMDAIMSFGRPASVKYCCLIDRGHRELPMSADYVGLTVPTHVNEEVRVHVKALDGEDAVYLVQREESAHE